MKKIISLILMLTCLIVPFSTIAEVPDSPTFDKLWWAEPSLEFQLIKDHDEFNEYLALISTYYDLEGFTEMVLGTDDYELVDMIIVTLDKDYRQVIWHTPYGFATTDNLCIFMISTNLWNGYVMNANANKDGNIVVNYTEVSPNEYFMIIYVAH